MKFAAIFFSKKLKNKNKLNIYSTPSNYDYSVFTFMKHKALVSFISLSVRYQAAS